MEDPARRKMMLKVYPVRQKVTPKGPDQASICDELGVRMCCSCYIDKQLAPEFILWCYLAVLVNSPLNFELNYVVVTCVTETVTSNNSTQMLLVMLHYCVIAESNILL